MPFFFDGLNYKFAVAISILDIRGFFGVQFGKKQGRKSTEYNKTTAAAFLATTAVLRPLGKTGIRLPIHF